MKNLSISLKDMANLGDLQQYKIKGVVVDTLLIYADDVDIFVGATERRMKAVKDILEEL